jgi:hypothetical protein
MLHCHHIEQRMHFLAIKDVVPKQFQDCYHRGRIICLHKDKESDLGSRRMAIHY